MSYLCIYEARRRGFFFTVTHSSTPHSADKPNFKYIYIYTYMGITCNYESCNKKSPWRKSYEHLSEGCLSVTISLSLSLFFFYHHKMLLLMRVISETRRTRSHAHSEKVIKRGVTIINEAGVKFMRWNMGLLFPSMTERGSAGFWHQRRRYWRCVMALPTRPSRMSTAGGLNRLIKVWFLFAFKRL